MAFTIPLDPKLDLSKVTNKCLVYCLILIRSKRCVFGYIFCPRRCASNMGQTYQERHLFWNMWGGAFPPPPRRIAVFEGSESSRPLRKTMSGPWLRHTSRFCKGTMWHHIEYLRCVSRSDFGANLLEKLVLEERSGGSGKKKGRRDTLDKLNSAEMNACLRMGP